MHRTSAVRECCVVEGNVENGRDFLKPVFHYANLFAPIESREKLMQYD
jgi:hypothetical protein